MGIRQKTEQENFWAGDFGNEYVDRNTLTNNIGSTIAMWSKIISKFDAKPKSAFEIGCNLGINLCALRQILPKIDLSAVEINAKAVQYANKNIDANIKNCSIFEYKIEKKFDIVFSCGVLIHINPDLLPDIYDKLYLMSEKYIFISEYYNPTPVEITYRGKKGKLFKRDFAGEMLEKFKDLKLIDYGFIYHRDPIFPKDDTTWFLLEKTNTSHS